ncbi:glycosyltransferase family 4 protein [Bosea sp. 124]|uniref:glycosyltransferase family 4 protein n=1 Tax=Bosea sp. 124 TaxID=2135642 RepID=UPI001AECBC73|nr:glycosyltransferase family 4 protein [Bosea sp. 124]
MFYAHNATAAQQAAAGFGEAFTWDIDLTSGYDSQFLRNVAMRPGTDHFAGCDTPDIGELLEAGRFTCVLALGWHLKSMLQGIFAAKRRRLPVLVRGDSQLGTPRGRIKTEIKRLAYPLLLRAFDGALYVGERNRDYFRHYAYPETQLFHSPHCVDTKRFALAATADARQRLRARLGIGANEAVLLFAGKLIPFKRPLDLVDAVALLRRDGLNARMLVAGSGPLEPDIRKRAAELGVTVDLLGFQNQSEMPAAYAAADLLALPSTGRETWGLVCNEALASGTPIIVSDQAGCAPDLAREGRVGRSYDMGDVAALAKACTATLTDMPARAEIAAVSEASSLDRAADGIIAAVNALGSRRRLSATSEQLQ